MLMISGVKDGCRSRKCSYVLKISESPEQQNKRDYLYYLAVGNARLKEYTVALKFIKALLQVMNINIVLYHHNNVGA